MMMCHLGKKKGEGWHWLYWATLSKENISDLPHSTIVIIITRKQTQTPNKRKERGDGGGKESIILS